MLIYQRVINVNQLPFLDIPDDIPILMVKASKFASFLAPILVSPGSIPDAAATLAVSDTQRIALYFSELIVVMSGSQATWESCWGLPH